ncbi:MAG TPA: ECF transporter S component [Anaerolineales bacterium]|nr:ECF transporter S component [Anaerolineales bacterium]
MKSRRFSLTIYLAATLSGVLVMLYPFFQPASSQQNGFGSIWTGQMPMMMTFLLGLCLLVLLFEAQGPMVNTKLIALLGILVAINSALRFIETAIPGPGGFTPIFFLIILVGYVFGGRVGFLMGALTLLVSALVTGGVGPWLPAQMFTAGWVGMSTPLLRPIFRAVALRQNMSERRAQTAELMLLSFFGLIWGFLYGAIMNLWQWPFIAGPQSQSYAIGLSVMMTVQHYLAFYLVTSLVWDIAAALGNVVLILAFGAPTLRALRRFKQRFEFTYSPEISVGIHPQEGNPEG